jgi:cell division protease FtsH
MDIKKHIATKDAELEKAAANLKKQFIGLDEIIDKIIANMRVWYILPETLRRPLIINLWGMTGVGKTDLVRKLVKELNFNDRFVEVAMDAGENKSAHSNDMTLEKRLEHSAIEESQQGILLLDEIQKFKTKGADGDELKTEHMGDLWNLLSDGKFGNEAGRKNKIVELALKIYWDRDYAQAEERQAKKNKEEPEDDDWVDYENDKDPKRKYKTTLWNAKEIKATLRRKEPIEEIMTWDSDKKESVVFEALDDPEVLSEPDYSKLLIFICGNLDEAYQMSHNTGDADTDADVLHEFSKNINVVDIKNCLRRRFRPEQIARFGNLHIIYPSLGKKSYQKIIDKTLKDTIKDFKKTVNVDVSLNQSVNEVLYCNGVFPSQGVRPVFTTINSFINQCFPMFLLKCLESKNNKISIDYKDSYAIAKFGTKTAKMKIEFDIDKIKKQTDINQKTMVSVHEAGHAIAYALLFGYSPSQICSNITSWEGGYILSHSLGNSKKQRLNSVKVALAGLVAEELAFGEELRSSGATSDIEKATGIVCDIVRRQGMTNYVARIDEGDANDDHEMYISDYDHTNQEVESMVAKLKQETRDLLKDNSAYLKVVSSVLLEQGEIKPKDFVALSKPFAKIKVKNSSDVVFEDYHTKFKKFLNEK